MILVDDRLAAELLAGRTIAQAVDPERATTWGFHFRVVRAIFDGRVTGVLSRAAEGAREHVLNPPAAVLTVLDPRLHTVVAAELSTRHQLNLLAADLLAAARTHSADVLVSERNVGRNWSSAFAAEGISLRIVSVG